MIVKNLELLISGALLNPFTRPLYQALVSGGNQPIQVRMRNGDWCEVVHLSQDASEGHPYDSEHVPDGAFISPDRLRYWHADGRSITSRSFDLVEHRLVA